MLAAASGGGAGRGLPLARATAGPVTRALARRHGVGDRNRPGTVWLSATGVKRGHSAGTGQVRGPLESDGGPAATGTEWDAGLSPAPAWARRIRFASEAGSAGRRRGVDGRSVARCGLGLAEERNGQGVQDGSYTETRFGAGENA